MLRLTLLCIALALCAPLPAAAPATTAAPGAASTPAPATLPAPANAPAPCRTAPSDTRPWPAGEIVAGRIDPDTCFAAAPLDAATRSRISGRSYKEGCPVALADLRYLRVLHRDFEGRTLCGEMICHREIADDLLAIFRALYDARYPIARMVLIDDYDADDTRSMEANNSSSFNFRPIAGSRSLSRHALGRAVDINPLFNPCVRTRDGRTTIEPEAARPYADRTRDFPGRLDAGDLCVELFKARGFRWGGDWRSLKDYQHFEK